MAHCPAAFSCHATKRSSTFSCGYCTTKSTMVVVPPQAAALGPVSNVSEAKVPPNGISMWVCASTPPGRPYRSLAAITRSTFLARSKPSRVDPGASTAAMVSPSISTSASAVPVAFTTVPFVISVFVTRSSFDLAGSRCDDRRVGVGPAVAEELPRVAHLADQVEIEVADDDVLVLAAAAIADEVPLRIDELARPVEGDRLLAVLVVLAPDPVRGADEVAVGRGGGGLL